MKKKLFSNKAPLILCILGAFFISTANANKIKNLTSDKTAEKVKTGEIETSSTPTQSIPGQLGKHAVGIGIGQTFLRGDFADNGDDEITLDLLYNYTASYSFDLLVDAHYSKHEYQNKNVETKGLAVSIKAKLFQFDAFFPFALAGLGFYAPQTLREVNGALVESEEKVVFGTNFGVGSDLKLNDKFTVGVMAQFHNPFDVKQDVGEEVEGSYLKLLIATFYTF